MGVCAHAVNVCASLQYWYNPTTSESSWEPPAGMADETATPAAVAGGSKEQQLAMLLANGVLMCIKQNERVHRLESMHAHARARARRMRARTHTHMLTCSTSRREALARAGSEAGTRSTGACCCCCRRYAYCVCTACVNDGCEHACPQRSGHVDHCIALLHTRARAISLSFLFPHTHACGKR